MPKVTVLMPVYNASPFLGEAIESILHQSFKDFEFLIIDDGSTDHSVQIIRSYTDERIRFFKNDRNIGISETLNRGIELSSCELIARMDADDISYRDRLQKQYDYMVTHPTCGLLSTWCRIITHDKKMVRLDRYPGRFYYYNLNFECWIYHPTVMFRKTVVKEVGMYSQPYSEDYDLFWKISQKFLIHNLNELLLDYRLSNTSLNAVIRKKEYDAANRENVIRNINRYMGNDFRLSEECLECLRHNFEPILGLKNIEKILECLSTLDQINEKILVTENVNRNVRDIKDAAWFKRDFIIYQISRHLPFIDKLSLLIKTKKTELLFRKLRLSFRWRYNQIRSLFSEQETLNSK